MLLFVVVVAILFRVLNWYVAPAKPSERKDLVLALAQILGGTALLSGLYFTWRTLQVNREGQITERFTRAIEQLGSKELEIRLGGIYSLERIARDSERDHWTIMEVLTAYVRQHAPRRPEERQEGQEGPAVEKKPEEDSGEVPETTKVPVPAPDIQAIMTVIRRRTRYVGHGEPEPLDLHETNLFGANLSEANLSEAVLSRAVLSEANLSGANLSEANLGGANLWRARLSATWSAALSAGAYTPAGANLSGAYLSGANLSEANLFGANLSGANLSEANLSGVNLRGANLSGAYLSGAYLSGANLFGANLSEASLVYGANLSGASLSGANLSGATLFGANLSRVRNLLQEQLDGTAGDEATRLPSHVKPAPGWLTART